MSTLPLQPVLNANTAALQKMLKSSQHAVSVSGKFWNIDGKLAFWPSTGRYKFSNSKGGESGTLRGRAESLFEQIERLLAEF
jgi:hypothetical protein